MDFATYVDTVSPEIRLLIGVIVTVGISLAIAVPLRMRALAFADMGKDDDDAGSPDDTGDASDRETRKKEPKVPSPDNLGGKVSGFVTTAFVFLLAFTLGQMWGNASDAQTAAQQENAAYARAYVAASALPASSERDALVAAVQTYRKAVIDTEWPRLKQADRDNAGAIDLEAALRLADALNSAATSSAAQHPSFGTLKQAVSDMLSEANTRIAQVPGREVPGLVTTIFVLGIAMLALTAFFMPTRRWPYILMIGGMAALTAMLLFLLLETTNPFIGADAIPVPTLLQR